MGPPVGPLHLGAPTAVEATPTIVKIFIVASIIGELGAGALLKVEAGLGLGDGFRVRTGGRDDPYGEDESEREDREFHDVGGGGFLTEGV